ncbi:MAG: alpha/beta fold hydrolase [Salinisphaera sp.]|nr:alpha/beta fold hydrolase [Salinisphaera sp.]
MTPTITTLQLAANGLRFSARAAGQGPLVLCLHGFPDSAHGFDALLLTLAGAGYRAVAPFMRGYAPTTAPRKSDYGVPTLGRDVLALADALGAQRFHVIGHDWGAIAAYAAAAYAPRRIPGMVTAAVPPLRRFLANMRARQLRRSWYIGFFQLPWLSEHRLGGDDCALVERLWRAWSPHWEFTAADLDPVKNILSDPRSKRAALGYYRALPGLLCGPRCRRERARMLTSRLQVPTLMIAGESDGCIGPEMWRGTEICFTAPCNVTTMAAGHFMHRELPEPFAQAVLGHFADHRQGG